MNEIVLALKNIKKSIGEKLILNNVTFHLTKGDIFGYLGPNGAGKTTTVRIILGLMSPDEGSVEILGESISCNQKILNSVGVVLDSTGLFEDLCAQDNLAFFAEIYRIPQIERKKRIKEVLNLVDLNENNNKPMGTYSTGLKKRLAIARSMLHNPQILILDEPTSNLDPEAQINIRNLIIELSHAHTIMFTSHNLDEVQRICTSIGIISAGEIKLFQPMTEILNHYHPILEIELLDNIKPQDIYFLNTSEIIESYKLDEKKLTIILANIDYASEIINLLTAHKIPICEAKRSLFSLEELYLTSIKHN